MQKLNIKISLGFTLIELLIAISISLLLLSLLMGIYLTADHAMRLQTSLYTIKDNAKSAIHFLTTDIQQAGNIGCAKLTPDFPIQSSSSYSLTANNKIHGTNNEITIRHAQYPNVSLIKNMRDKNTLYANNNLNFSEGDVLIISNCKRAEIFSVKKVIIKKEFQKIISSSSLHYKYEKFSEVSLLAINRYYIDKTKRKTSNGLEIKALYLQDIKNFKTELVSGIKNIKLTYTAYDSNKFKDLSASEISNWNKVVGVAIDINLISSSLNKNWHAYTTL